MTKPRYLAFNLTILGKRWTVYYCSERHFKKKHPELAACSLAVSVREDKEVFLRTKHLTKETVTHELVHAWLWELCVTSTDYTADQITEVFCDMLPKYGRKIMRQADQVMDAYQILRGRKE